MTARTARPAFELLPTPIAAACSVSPTAQSLRAFRIFLLQCFADFCVFAQSLRAFSHLFLFSGELCVIADKDSLVAHHLKKTQFSCTNVYLILKRMSKP